MNQIQAITTNYDKEIEIPSSKETDIRHFADVF